ncbi:MAG: C25 family cysteine peptidase [candidate division WOR-3 bacterium]
MVRLLLFGLCMANLLNAGWQRVIGWSDLSFPPEKVVIKSDTAGVFIKTTIYGFNRKDTLIDNKNFQQITIPDCELDLDTIKKGKPQIPYIRLLIAVPDSCNFNININPIDFTVFSNYLIYPVPRIVFEDSDGLCYYKEVYIYDTAFYQKDTLYPNKFYEIKNDGYWRDQRVLEILIYPVQFNPQKKLMYFYTGIDLKIEYTGRKSPNTNGLGPFEDIGRELLLDYPGIDREPGPHPEPKVHYYTDLLNPENVADYIIVTHDQFLINETTSRWIHDFARWRVDHNRFDVGIVKVQDIYVQFPQSALDSAAQLKDFLNYAYHNWQSHSNPDNHFAYCLFIGDWDYVPAKLSYYQMAEYLWLEADERYFADIDGQSYLPEIMLGRWPVKPTQQLVTIAQKTLNYEKYPDTGDWRRRVHLICGGTSGPDFGIDPLFERFITEAKSFPADIAYDTQTTRWSEYYPNADDYKNAIQYWQNAGEIITYYVNHGAPDGWYRHYDSLWINQLQNGTSLPFVISGACLTAMFQWDRPRSTYDPNYPPHTCFAEHFLFKTNGGAIGFFGAHKFTCNIPDSRILSAFFQKQHWEIGKALASNPWVFQDYCLLGDPALDLGDYAAYPNLPDLVVRPQGIDISLLPPYPYPSSNATIPIKAKILNIGHIRATNVVVNFKVSKDQAVYHTENIVVPEIKSRDTAVVIAHWNTGQSHPNFYGEIGNCKVEVTVDPNDHIEESWEYNNKSSIVKKIALYSNQPNWPKRVTNFANPAVGNLDNFGAIEVVYPSGDSVYVFNADGSNFTNWPRPFVKVYSVVLADIDDNRTLEIIAASPESITVYDYQGNILPGWPVQIPNPGQYKYTGMSALGKIQTNTTLDIISTAVPKTSQVTGPLKIFVYSRNGVVMNQFNSQVQSNIFYLIGPAIGNVISGGDDEIAITYCREMERQVQKTEVYNRDGLVTTLNFGSSYMTPALGDITGDGYADLIIGCSDGYIRAYDVQNNQLLWERLTEGPINSSPAVGDIHPDYDGVEITFGNDGSAINLRRNDNGELIPPWSYIISPSTAVRASPAIANINGDQYLNIIIGADNQYIYVFKHTKDSIPPFPLPLFGLPSSPIIGDIDGDRKSEIIFSSSDGYLHIWKNRNSQVTQYLLEWPQFHHDYQRTGLYNWSP